MTAVRKGVLTTYMRYDDTELSEESLKIAKEKIKETEENKKKCLDILKKKLIDKENLIPCLQEDFLLAYLRVAKYDVNAAYHRIIKYYDERWIIPEVFQDFSSSTIKIVETARDMYVVPYRRKDNSAVLILKRKEYDPSKVHYHLILRSVFLGIEYLIRHPVNQMCGVTVLLDLKCSSWSAWSEYTPARLKMLARLMQKSIAVRFCSVHVINAPSVYYLLYSIVYPFLSTKLRQRIFIHKSFASLHSQVEPELLPKEYGGHLQQSDLINAYERIYQQEDLFSKISKYGFTKRRT